MTFPTEGMFDVVVFGITGFGCEAFLLLKTPDIRTVSVSILGRAVFWPVFDIPGSRVRLYFSLKTRELAYFALLRRTKSVCVISFLF